MVSRAGCPIWMPAHLLHTVYEVKGTPKTV